MVDVAVLESALQAELLPQYQQWAEDCAYLATYKGEVVACVKVSVRVQERDGQSVRKPVVTACLTFPQLDMKNSWEVSKAVIVEGLFENMVLRMNTHTS